MLWSYRISRRRQHGSSQRRAWQSHTEPGRGPRSVGGRIDRVIRGADGDGKRRRAGPAGILHAAAA
jgi:hypothetical protein